MEEPLFAQRAAATLARCKETYSNRGDQYGDTWAQCQWLYLKATLFTRYGIKPSLSECRATALAALADVKYSRVLGGYNDDHILDGINYMAALAEEMREVYKEGGKTVIVEHTDSDKARGIDGKMYVRVNGQWKDL